MAFFRCNPLVLICKRSINNGFKRNQTKTPFSHHKFISSMKTQVSASNTENPGRDDSAAAVSGDGQPSQTFDVLTKTEKFNDFPEFQFKDYLSSKVKQVNEALDQTVPLQHPTQIHEAMRYSLLLPGKRFSPVLCLASCELVGGDEAKAVPFACALEMIHTMSLMLDDLPCMDDDDLRSGKPASHKVFGEETAILAGSSLLSLAFQHIAERTKNVPAERILRAIVELASATGFDGMLGGQLLDLHSEGKEVSLAELEYIHVQKTAKLLEASAVCGAMMGGGSEGEIERLRRYARHIGLMYQVVDDIVGLTKSSEELGKTAKKDLGCDKAIYPKFMGMEGAKRCVEELKAKAMEELSYFDATTTRASPLYYLANFVANRIN